MAEDLLFQYLRASDRSNTPDPDFQLVKELRLGKSHNLTELEELLGNFQCLESLQAKHCALDTWPENLNLARLTTLNLEGNDLCSASELPVAQLKSLVLSHNPIGPTLSLPVSPLLRELLAIDCGLETLPDDLFTRLPVLGYLDLSHNHLTSLPEISSEHPLSHLLLSHNQLESVEESYMKRAFTDLDLRQNKILNLPEEFRHQQFVRTDVPDEIWPSLFLGNEGCSQNLVVLESLGITHILRVTPDPCEYPQKFKYHCVPILDTDVAQLGPYLDAALTFTSKALSSGGRVLVHCTYGKSRSASFVIAYGMLRLSLSFEEAHTHVVASRPRVRPNHGFIDQLRDLENRPPPKTGLLSKFRKLWA